MLIEPDEDVAIQHVTQRLKTSHGDGHAPAEVEAAVATAYASFEAMPIWTHLPVLVERQTRRMALFSAAMSSVSNVRPAFRAASRLPSPAGGGGRRWPGRPGRRCDEIGVGGHRRTRVQSGASPDTREGAIGSCLDTPRAMSPIPAQVQLAGGRAIGAQVQPERPSKRHLVHVLPSASASEMSATGRH